MTQQAAIMNLVNQNNGMLTTAKAVSFGMSRSMLAHLVKQGQLLRPARGLYTLPEIWEDEFLNLQTRFKRGIYHMTFPTNYNLANPKKEGVRCAQVKPEWYVLGIAEIKSPTGNSVHCYSIERTLCDILRPHHSADIQITAEAFKRYTNSPRKNIPLLSDYAACFGVEKKIRTYLEVLL